MVAMLKGWGWREWVVALAWFAVVVFLVVGCFAFADYPDVK